MTILQRMQASTPIFFRKVRNVSLATTAISAAILSAKFALPAEILQVASYLAVAGGIASAISQAVTDDKMEKENTNL